MQLLILKPEREGSMTAKFPPHQTLLGEKKKKPVSSVFVWLLGVCVESVGGIMAHNETHPMLEILKSFNHGECIPSCFLWKLRCKSGMFYCEIRMLNWYNKWHHHTTVCLISVTGLHLEIISLKRWLESFKLKLYVSFMLSQRVNKSND